ncbi:UDP-N-acetylmuramate dehydrogenase [Neptunomonas japonica]|uniref:UDP-N-acetylmuramate dehydrogenase n=1 Tax=Neptunomonas japonica TaxID=417574 RepID=UPI0003FF5007|nr:UDP-N-acetylmuramate dehydrogenase [Neptunomonas japonica]
MSIEQKLQKNHSLQASNTLGFSAFAEYFLAVTSEAELVAAIDYAQQNDLAVRVLGGGSNVLMAPQVDGLVIRIDIMGKKVLQEGVANSVLSKETVDIVVGGGENWHETVAWSVAQSLSGMESMALIPGRVGAAPVQNIGAYGQEMKDIVFKVRAYQLETGRFVELFNDDCGFAYRDSVFKQSPGQFIITEVVLRLSCRQDESIRYAALQSYFIDQGINLPDIKQIFDAVCAVRRSKLPDPDLLGNAGSFFKNPVITQAQFEQLKLQWPSIVAYPENKGFMKLAAGWLIDQCDWKGKRVGHVGVYEKQALVLVHFGGGDRAELLALASDIQASVLASFCVELEVEPQLFPFV